jgi:16S rRNA (cytosine1402-N4)-methyltransferase
VAARPVDTTKQLAEIVAKSIRSGKPGIHPATRTFQALRIATNQELEAVEQVLPQAVDALESGGCLAVISFHSLEDRIVKQFFRRESQDCLCPPKQPQCTCGHKASLRVLTRKPVQPSETETRENPRARSSRLRVAKKI